MGRLSKNEGILCDRLQKSKALWPKVGTLWLKIEGTLGADGAAMAILDFQKNPFLDIQIEFVAHG